ncbi:interleukin-15 receptor subunit alpha [Enoplosus armatus]|uniref:interleukin-15 receptor subunit alpha n=1 Tax=Enoplosus armatus TaxID=215367 RepID=UPI003995D4B2
MDLGPPLFSVCVMMTCLLGAARCSNGDQINCLCSEIRQLPLTEPPPGTCFQSTFRYTCIEGHVRKVGTSNLIKCKEIKGVPEWTTPTLQCITDPKRTTTQPPKTTVTEGHTDIPLDFILATTVTAASTSLQMTQNISISASVAAETDSAEPSSPGLQGLSSHSQVDVVTETRATEPTTSTSTTAEPSNNGRVSDLKLDSKTTAMITGASLLVCALIGIGILCYRRRLKISIPPYTTEEALPMNRVPSAPAS